MSRCKKTLTYLIFNLFLLTFNLLLITKCFYIITSGVNSKNKIVKQMKYLIVSARNCICFCARCMRPCAPKKYLHPSDLAGVCASKCELVVSRFFRDLAFPGRPRWTAPSSHRRTITSTCVWKGRVNPDRQTLSRYICWLSFIKQLIRLPLVHLSVRKYCH